MIIEAKPAAVLVLGTADWNQPIATNQHYLTRELCADSSLSVTFVESLALRQPTLSARDLRRIATRLGKVIGRRQPREGASRPVPNRLKVTSPLVLPFHRGLPARINAKLLRSHVERWLSWDGPRILWCYTPTSYGLEQDADAVIYHCVDLLADVPGIDPTVVRVNERRLAESGARAVASSQVVRSHLEEQGFHDVQLWENVADTSVFSRESASAESRSSARIMFAGNLSPLKVDYGLLSRLSEAGLDVCVAGPRAEGGGQDQEHFDRLLRSGVSYLGMLSLDELARELGRSTVGLIPYVLNPYTRGVSPLKTYEYLAAGLAVVSTDLPGVHEDREDVFVERSVDEFVERVQALATAPEESDVARRAAKAAAHSWDTRGAEARRLARELIPTS